MFGPRHAGGCCHSSALRARGAPKTGALASRRSTAALVRRSQPPNSAPGHASCDLAGTHDLMDRQPGRRSYASPRALPRARLSQSRDSSTSHTGRSTGALMPEAARERVTSPRAGAALAPFQGVSSRRTSLDGRDGAPSSRRAAVVNRCRTINDFSLIPRHFLLCRFLQAGSKRGEFGRIERIFVAGVPPRAKSPSPPIRAPCRLRPQQQPNNGYRQKTLSANYCREHLQQIRVHTARVRTCAGTSHQRMSRQGCCYEMPGRDPRSKEMAA